MTKEKTAVRASVQARWALARLASTAPKLPPPISKAIEAKRTR
jgi:hypothetical protein